MARAIFCRLKKKYIKMHSTELHGNGIQLILVGYGNYNYVNINVIGIVLIDGKI